MARMKGNKQTNEKKSAHSAPERTTDNDAAFLRVCYFNATAAATTAYTNVLFFVLSFHRSLVVTKLSLFMFTLLVFQRLISCRFLYFNLEETRQIRFRSVFLASVFISNEFRFSFFVALLSFSSHYNDFIQSSFDISHFPVSTTMLAPFFCCCHCHPFLWHTPFFIGKTNSQIKIVRRKEND